MNAPMIKAALRVLAAGALGLGLTACGGGGNGGSFSPYGSSGLYADACAGTQVALASPQAGAYNVPTNIGQITIVANGSGNALSQNPAAFTLEVSDSGYMQGDYFTTSPLNPVSDTNGPHPYASDYYYQLNFSQQLLTQQTWTVYLVSAACSQPVGQFST
jgi:hypothetical protein